MNYSSKDEIGYGAGKNRLLRLKIEQVKKERAETHDLNSARNQKSFRDDSMLELKRFALVRVKIMETNLMDHQSLPDSFRRESAERRRKTATSAP